MFSARCARRHARRPPRLVAASRTPLDGREWGLYDDAIDGWRVGLYAAGFLRTHFPEVFARVVADRTITTARLLGAANAFLTLAHRELLTMDLSYYCPIAIAPDEDDAEIDVAEIVEGYIDHGGILDALCGEIHPWLVSPPLQVYGVERALGETQGGPGLLALALWMIGVHTSWRIAPPSAILKCFPARSKVRIIIRTLPCLPGALPMRLLCDSCAWSCDLPGVSGPWRLGDIVRFAFSQFGNEFADMSPAELHDNDWGMLGIDLWEGIWASRHLAVERARQQGARRLREVYDALNAAVSANPALLHEIALVLLRDAQAILAVPALEQAMWPPEELLRRGAALLAEGVPAC